MYSAKFKKIHFDAAPATTRKLYVIWLLAAPQHCAVDNFVSH
jgi:hypothetical protein